MVNGNEKIAIFKSTDTEIQMLGLVSFVPAAERKGLRHRQINYVDINANCPHL